MDAYRQKALELEAEPFAKLFDHLFLVRIPSRKEKSLPPEASPLEFRTQAIEVSGGAVEDDNLGQTWLVEPVRKKPGRPFPERISIGRAVNCDITIRMSYISKLHAYFVCEPGSPLRLVDNRSANGTWVGGERLRASQPRVVEVGARIKLGALELDLIDARHIHPLLRRSA